MFSTFTASVRDGLSNLAASLGAGRDKAAADAFTLRDLSRAEVEAMYRGDWLARKVVDIVPADMCREWRAFSGPPEAVVRMEAAERRLGLRRAVERALVLGRLYGGGAIVIGTGERDPAALARPLDPRAVRPGGLAFLHVVSRWQLGTPGLDRDPLSPWYGEAELYEVVAPGRGALQLHPSRVVRFLGNPWPDPSVAPTPWSDSVLQALYDAVHAVALTVAGATSLMHEAKVDVVTVPNLSEHLSSAETTAQLSARFGYAATMKSINNLLLLGDGETWNRSRIDFAGLPEMVKTFLQVAAGAADIPVTRLLGQSPAGLSATGESDTRNYYDMIAARQELALRPALERLDRVISASEGLDAGAPAFAFRPLWQLDAASAATVALQKAQATQIYAGLNLWPAGTTARLVGAQLAADGTYPNASAVFGEGGALASPAPTLDYAPDQPRDWHGRWTAGAGLEHAGEMLAGGSAARVDPAAPPRAKPASPSPGGILGFLNALNPIGTAQAQEIDPEEENRREFDPLEREPGEVLRLERWNKALERLREIDPENPHLRRLEPPNYVPSEANILTLEQAAREALAARACDPLRPEGRVEPTFEPAPSSSLVPARAPPTTPLFQGSKPSSEALLAAAAEVAAHIATQKSGAIQGEPLPAGTAAPASSDLKQPPGQEPGAPPNTSPSTPPSLSAERVPPNLTLADLARVTRGFAGRKSAQKWLNQMNGRGWTPDQIEEAISGGESFPAANRISPEHAARGYIHPRTGRYVVVDSSTGEVIQLAGDGFDR